MSDVKWTLWVFAGPGAFTGLCRDGDGLAHASTEPGEPPALGPVLARLLGPDAAMPAGVRVLAELTGMPTLLQELTDQWPTARLVADAGHALAEPSMVGPGERDLRSFLEWSEHHTPPGCRRALIVLGDVLRAVSDHATAVDDLLGPGRPNYPSKVVIRKDSAKSETYLRTPSGTWQVQGSNDPPVSSETLYQQAAAVRGTGEVQGSDPLEYTDSWVARLVELKGIYNGPGATRSATLGSPEARVPTLDDGNTRRIEMLVSALVEHEAPAGVSARLDMLVSDDRDLTQLLALRQLAPHVEVILGSPLPRPIAGRPLVDLLEALAKDPTLDAEALADDAIALGHRRAELLMRRSEKLLVRAELGASSERLTSARALVNGGSETIAIRSIGIPEIVDTLEALADRARARLDSDHDWDQSSMLRNGLLAARAHGGELGRVTEHLRAIDEQHDTLRERAEALESAVRKATVAHRELHDDAHARRPTLGLSLGHAGLGEDSSWRGLLDALTTDARSEVQRRTLADLEVLATRSRRASRDAARAHRETAPLRWIELDAHEPDAELETVVDDLLDRAPARHVGLVVRGTAQGSSVVRPGSRSGPMSIVTLARCLREALARRGSAPVAMLVLEDPALFGLEIAYELREVAHVLVTRVDRSAALPLARLDCLSDEHVAGCELAVAEGIKRPASGSIATVATAWRRDVAKRLADEVAARINASGLVLVGIDLRFVEALCRRFDRVCQLMLDSLGEDPVTAALRAGFEQDSLVDLVNAAQMSEQPPGIWHHAMAHGWTRLAKTLYDTLGTVYNWVSWPGHPIEEGGAPLWIGEPPDDDGRIHARHLRITAGANQPEDYRELSFHQDVRLHALLTAWRLIDSSGASNPAALWGLASLGIAFAPASARRRQLEQVLGDDDAAHYFTTFGPPPLMRLDIEEGHDGGYELRLGSDDSAAVLVRRHSMVNLGTVDGSLDGLSHVVSRGSTSDEGWRYIESLGASLAEDVIGELHEQIERERVALLGSARGRDAHLALALPRELMRYPWELMLLPPRAPGLRPELLAERFAVGRQMWSDRAVRRIRRDDPIRVLIVGAPRRPSGSRLEGALAEAEQLASLCETISDELAGELDFERERDAFIGTTVTRAVLRRLVREGRYDVLHFAGHGSYDSRRPERSGWLLSDGLLTATELRNTLAWAESPPWLIFGNACDSAMTDDRSSGYQGEIHGMAEACIRVGVNAYVGPLWKVHDESARMLATELYRNLLLRRSTIGAALRLARVTVRSTWEKRRRGTGLADVSWAGMVLFGNPTERINETASR